ncbi:MAG: acyl carrier protein [Candidatus Zixiibacteriota bacterium]|nr:MAG: acyl carrier protein [candidate division Zixibacteria bacterium]
MSNGMNNNEQKEAEKVSDALDSFDFNFSEFEPWLKNNGFTVHDVGRFFSFKGGYGYIQLEFVIIGGKSTVVNCSYIPYSNTSRGYGLVVEGVSSSGKSLSGTSMKLLKKLRYDLVGTIIVNVIVEETGLEVEPTNSLDDELELDELDVQEIILRVEDEFDIIIPDEEMEGFGTVDDIITFVRKTKGML